MKSIKLKIIIVLIISFFFNCRESPKIEMLSNDSCISHLKKFQGTWSNGQNLICICNMHPSKFTDECNKEGTPYQSIDENSVTEKGDQVQFRVFGFHPERIYIY